MNKAIKAPAIQFYKYYGIRMPNNVDGRMIAECRNCGANVIIAYKTDPCPECRRLYESQR